VTQGIVRHNDSFYGQKASVPCECLNHQQPGESGKKFTGSGMATEPLFLPQLSRLRIVG
jgi:hypothetical protein